MEECTVCLKGTALTNHVTNCNITTNHFIKQRRRPPPLYKDSEMCLKGYSTKCTHKRSGGDPTAYSNLQLNQQCVELHCGYCRPSFLRNRRLDGINKKMVLLHQFRVNVIRVHTEMLGVLL